MKKIYKEVKRENGTVTIYGSNRWKQLYYAIPEWRRGEQDQQDEPYFIHQNRRHYLSEFMAIGKHSSDWMHEFDGYANDSFFSGLFIKMDCEEDRVKVFLYIS